MANNNLEDVILKAIDIIATKKVKQAGYDKTVLATVVSCQDQKKGKYKVKYQDSYWIAYSNNINISYAKNSSVYILIPGGDMSKNKTILGGVKQLGVDYKALTQEDIVNINQEIYIMQGQNIIKNDSILSLCSYKEDIKVLYTKQEAENFINIDQDAAKEYFKNSTNFSISMDIQNDLIPEQRYKGNYGIIVGIDFKDNSTGDLVTRYYTLDVDSMTGNPYYFLQQVPQSKAFEIDGQNFIGINNIILFAKDFPIQNQNEQDDIFISNLSIGAVSILSSDELSGYSLSLLTPKGYIFNQNSTNNEERSIQAQVRSRGKILDFDTNNIKIYWFRQNVSVTTNHDKYNKYGGQGWQCLNEYGIIEQPVYDIQGNISEPATYGFKSGKKNFTVKKSDVLAYTNKYKCVVVYENNILSKELKIIRQDCNYEFLITSNAGTSFYYDTGSPTLTCHCREKTSNNRYVDMNLSTLKFVWIAINHAGNFQSLQVTNDSNIDKNKLILIKNSILRYIQLGFLQEEQIYNVEQIFLTDYDISQIDNDEIRTEIEEIKQNFIQAGITSQNDITNLFSKYRIQINSGISYDLLLNGDTNHHNTLTQAINNYNSYQKVIKNQIINLNIKTITKFATYKCSIFTLEGNQYLGSASITITNSLSAQNDYTLIIENGTQVFKYNTAGISPASKRKTNPQLIPLLSFSIYDSQGNRIDDDITSKCQNSWIIPFKDTLLKPNNGYTEGILTTDEQDIVYKNLSVFAYSIAEIYNNNKTRNNIELQINYNGMNLTARTNLSFLKEGEQGTNGTDFVCKIIPNTSDEIPVTPIIYYNGSRTFFNWEQDIEDPWFKVQLWHNNSQPIFSGVTSGDSTEGKFVTVVKWEVLKNIYYSNTYLALNIQDQTNLRIEPDLYHDSWIFSLEQGDLSNSWNRNIYTSWRPSNIIKVTISYDGALYYGILPITICRLFSNTGLINVKLKDYSGFNQVLYNSAGMKPEYDSHAPFEVLLQTKNNLVDEWEDISLNDEIQYQWFYMGSVFYKNKTTNTWDEVYQETNGDESSKLWLTKSYMGSQTLQKNQKYIKPIDTYNGECLNTGLACKISRQYNNSNEQVLAWIHIPIHFYFNRFENSAINSWDGNSINLGGDNGGMILSPQAGSGYKDNNNKFTGVVMGIAKDPSQEISNQSGLISNYDTGLFGYSSGVRTFFLDSKTGKSTFGQTGQAQIIIDPTQRNIEGRVVAQIKSGNYDTIAKTGLLIDLSTPEICYGSGNFYVDKDGFLYASGAKIDGTLSVDTQIEIPEGETFSYSSIRSLGSAIDLKISNNDLQSRIELLPNEIRLDSTGPIVWNADNSSMDEEGTFQCSSAKIGGWTIKPYGIFRQTQKVIGQSGKCYQVQMRSLPNDIQQSLNDNNYAFAVLTKSYTSTTEDNWISQFYVNYGGKLFAKNADISGTINSSSGNIGGWSISSTYLSKWASYDYDISQNNVKGVLINAPVSPTDDHMTFVVRTADWNGTTHTFSNYKNKFYVTYAGKMYSENAYIKGHIEANEGKISGFDLSDHELKYNNYDSISRKYATWYQNYTGSHGVNLGADGFQLWGWYSKSGICLAESQLIFYNQYGSKLCAFRLNNSTDKDVIFDGDFLWCKGAGQFDDDVTIRGDLSVTGRKPRIIQTKDYATRRLYAYETASPMFSDIGRSIINEDGLCYIVIEPIFSETILTKDYFVFLQPQGQGELFVKEKKQYYFIIQGTPNLKFSWEIKAKQIDYTNERLLPVLSTKIKNSTIDYSQGAIDYIKNLKMGRILNENSNIYNNI